MSHLSCHLFCYLMACLHLKRENYPLNKRLHCCHQTSPVSLRRRLKIRGLWARARARALPPRTAWRTPRATVLPGGAAGDHDVPADPARAALTRESTLVPPEDLVAHPASPTGGFCSLPSEVKTLPESRITYTNQLARSQAPPPAPQPPRAGLA